MSCSVLNVHVYSEDASLVNSEIFLPFIHWNVASLPSSPFSFWSFHWLIIRPSIFILQSFFISRITIWKLYYIYIYIYIYLHIYINLAEQHFEQLLGIFMSWTFSILVYFKWSQKRTSFSQQVPNNNCLIWCSFSSYEWESDFRSVVLPCEINFEILSNQTANREPFLAKRRHTRYILAEEGNQHELLT